MGKDAGDQEENVKKYRQETVDFRILQRNGFGFPSVISLANLPQRLPSPLLEERTQVLGRSRYYSPMFLYHAEKGRRSIGERLVSGGKRRRVKREYEWSNSFSLALSRKCEGDFSVSKYKGKLHCSRGGRG